MGSAFGQWCSIADLRRRIAPHQFRSRTPLAFFVNRTCLKSKMIGHQATFQTPNQHLSCGIAVASPQKDAHRLWRAIWIDIAYLRWVPT
jgi:hypothetical protein